MADEKKEEKTLEEAFSELDELRPCCIANAALLAKCLPQLFCDVWSEWSDEDDEICQEFLVAALLLTEFVHGNHEG